MAAERATSLDVEVLGAGPVVLLLHGSVLGRRTWRAQRELADSWTLKMPHRPGFGTSPPLTRGDFEAEAPLFAELLGEGAHLVGHSYGAVSALYAAALRPQAVRSLIVSEPGCLRVAAGDALVDEAISHGEQLYAQAAHMTPTDFLRLFRNGTGSLRDTPAHLEGELLTGARLLMSERPPWEAEPPLALLREQPFPKLVLSGGHSPVFERVCDVLAAQLGASRGVIAGRAHSVPAVVPLYNERLRAFLKEAERSATDPQSSSPPVTG